MRKIVAAMTAAGGPFSFATTKNRIGRGPRCGDGHSRRAIFHRHDDYTASIRKSGPEIKNHCTLEGINRQKHASIRKSGLEIKNRCTQEGVNRHILAVISKFTPSNQESLQPRGHFWAKPCSDSQVYPLKPGIAAAPGPKLEETMQRFQN